MCSVEETMDRSRGDLEHGDNVHREHHLWSRWPAPPWHHSIPAVWRGWSPPLGTAAPCLQHVYWHAVATWPMLLARCCGQCRQCQPRSVSRGPMPVISRICCLSNLSTQPHVIHSEVKHRVNIVISKDWQWSKGNIQSLPVNEGSFLSLLLRKWNLLAATSFCDNINESQLLVSSMLMIKPSKQSPSLLGSCSNTNLVSGKHGWHQSMEVV